MFTRFLVGLFTVVLIAAVAHARHVEPWSYDKLSSRADAVVVATVVSTSEWEEPDEAPQMGSVVFEGQLTKFEIQGVLKGKVTGRSMELVHYRVVANGKFIAPGVKVVHSRAYVADFTERKAAIKNRATKDVEEDGPSHYLLFLKQRKNGRFEPVSGQVDSACSVMILKPEGPARWHREDTGERFAE